MTAALARVTLPPQGPSAPGPPGFTVASKDARVVHEACRKPRTHVPDLAREEAAPCA